jgi:hypothetical protein
MCGNGGSLLLCGGAKCSCAICYGTNTQCLTLPVDLHFEDPDVLFICPPCHQDSNCKANKPSPYYVCSFAMTHFMTILSSPSYKGFYAVSGPHPSLDGTQTHTVPSGSKPQYGTQTLELCVKYYQHIATATAYTLIVGHALPPPPSLL